MQIALRAGKRLVTQIGRQHRQLGIEVCALAVPAQQGMAGKGVAKIMDSRSFASAGVRNSTSQQQLPVQRIDALETPRAIPWRWEEVRIGWTSPELRGVLLQTLYQGQGGRNQTILAKLALAHCQDAAIKVDVGYTQMQHFAEPEAAAVEQTKHFRHDEVAQRRLRSWRELVDGAKQCMNLGVRQDAWCKSSTTFSCQRSIRHIGEMSQPAHVLSELSNDADAMLLRCRALVRLLGEPLPSNGAR